MIEEKKQVQAMLDSKLGTLNRLQKQYNFEHELYQEIRNAIMFNQLTNEEDLAEFTNKFPPKLRSLIQLNIHSEIFDKISIFS